MDVFQEGEEKRNIHKHVPSGLLGTSSAQLQVLLHIDAYPGQVLLGSGVLLSSI